MKIRRILAAVDFSEPSLAALEAAVELAGALRASIDILCVLEPVLFAPPTGPAVELGAVRGERERVAGERLSALRSDLAARRIRCRTQVGVGSPERVILDRAAKLPADLVVMGTHGRSGLSHLLLGSVAERVMRGAPCPVVTARARAESPRRTARGR